MPRFPWKALTAAAVLTGCAGQVSDTSLDTEEAAIAQLAQPLFHKGLYVVEGKGQVGGTVYFGPGRHRASRGDFGSIGDNNLTQIRLPPASTVRLCRIESSEGLSCSSFTNQERLFSLPTFVVPPLTADVSFLELIPMVILYEGTDFTGAKQMFGYGEHRANAGQFTTVRNDQARSIYIAPGARARVCEHEGGVSGHGAGHCKMYDGDSTTLISNVSYIEVQPVVTAFADVNLTGDGFSFGPGIFKARDGGLGLGNDWATSVVIPHGLTATLCNDDTTGSTGNDCVTYDRSQISLPANLSGLVSYVNVQAPNVAKRALTVKVSTASTATGKVVSSPYGISCTTGTCSTQVAIRSPVQLSAVLPTGTQASWGGCSSLGWAGKTCQINPENTNLITVTFNTIVVDPEECAADCADSCVDVLHPAQCVLQCEANCSDAP